MYIPQLTICQAEGAAFTVATPGNLHICVSSEQQISELEKAPENHFSLHAIAKDVGSSLSLNAERFNHCTTDVPAKIHNGRI